MEKKVIQHQMLQNNLRIIQERETLITRRLEELRSTKLATEELKNIKPSDALIPIGSGNFVFGRILDSNNIIVGIGSGVAIKKKRKDAIEILEKKINEVENVLDDLSNQAQIIIDQMRKIELEVQK